MYKYTLEAINSKADVYGDRYWAFVYSDGEHTVNATISGGLSNIQSVPYELNGGSYEPRDYYFTHSELPIRQFNKLVKGWNYAGCAPADLAKYIQAHLSPEVKS